MQETFEVVDFIFSIEERQNGRWDGGGEVERQTLHIELMCQMFINNIKF